MFVDEKQQGEPQTAEQANRKLKLSEAIRIGAAKRPQGIGNDCYRQGKSCALMAAFEAVRNRPVSSELDIEDMYRLAFDIVGGHQKYDLVQRVWERNDDGETREQVADWLESQGQ